MSEAGRRGVRQAVLVRSQALVRLTPGSGRRRTATCRPDSPDSKFGFGLGEGQAAEAVAPCHRAPNLDLVGIHAHIGSQIFDLSSYRQAIEVLVESLAVWRRDYGFECRLFNLGGGLGIRYTPRDEPASIAEFADTRRRHRPRAGREARACRCRASSSSRAASIVGKAAVTAYRVGGVKQIPGVRTYVAVDGGMSDNLRPMLYGSRYEAMLAEQGRSAGRHRSHGRRQALRVGRRPGPRRADRRRRAR